MDGFQIGHRPKPHEYASKVSRAERIGESLHHMALDSGDHITLYRRT